MKRKILALMGCLALVATALVFPATALAEATTSVHIVKYAVDGTTILDEETVSYEWMKDNLPVQGDGTTVYYHQGIVSSGDVWDPTETQNLKSKGAVKGTDLKDLCELVGGMNAGDMVRVSSPDGFFKEFHDYQNVYSPQPRQGPMVICWYKDGAYVPTYASGMELVFMAQTTTAGKYVFGNWDMHECLPSSDWHWYDPTHPATTGLSVKYVGEIAIYSDEPVPTPPVPEASTFILVGTGLLSLVGFVWVSRRRKAAQSKA